MTPKAKARELYEKYCNMNSHCDNAKECAFIAVDEIINTHLLSEKNVFGIHPIDYWQQVKAELQQL